VRRRARILEDKLANPEAAAACLRELGEDAVRDDELMAVLLRNLRRAGLAHEAARVLEQRIEIEREAGTGVEERRRVAELTLELSLLRLDELGDPEAARREIAARDAQDSSRALAPLRRAPDAVEVDTTGLSVDQVVTALAEAIERRRRDVPGCE
jgi:hypothetical protein